MKCADRDIPAQITRYSHNSRAVWVGKLAMVTFGASQGPTVLLQQSDQFMYFHYITLIVKAYAAGSSLSFMPINVETPAFSIVTP